MWMRLLAAAALALAAAHPLLPTQLEPSADDVDAMLTGDASVIAPVPRFLLALSAAAAPGERELQLSTCVELSEHSILGVGVQSINEEFVRVRSTNCSTDGPGIATLDRGLLYEHGEGERVGLLPDSMQVPSGRLYAPAGLGPPLAGASGELPVEHERALALARRAVGWLVLSAHVIADGPEKWALRHLLIAVAAVLIVGGCAAVVFHGCARVVRDSRAHKPLKG